jgi:hypothetical protein
MGSKSYSKGSSWIDDCRIPFVYEVDKPSAYQARKGGFQDVYVGGTTNNIQDENTKGRFPANLLVSDDMLNDGVISKSSLFNKTNTPIFDTKNGWNDNNISGSTGGGFNDKGTNSRYYDIDKWFDNLIDV